MRIFPAGNCTLIKDEIPILNWLLLGFISSNHHKTNHKSKNLNFDCQFKMWDGLFNWFLTKPEVLQSPDHRALLKTNEEILSLYRPIWPIISMMLQCHHVSVSLPLSVLCICLSVSLPASVRLSLYLCVPPPHSCPITSSRQRHKGRHYLHPIGIRPMVMS